MCSDSTGRATIKPVCVYRRYRQPSMSMACRTRARLRRQRKSRKPWRTRSRKTVVWSTGPCSGTRRHRRRQESFSRCSSRPSAYAGSCLTSGGGRRQDVVVIDGTAVNLISPRVSIRIASHGRGVSLARPTTVFPVFYVVFVFVFVIVRVF